MTYIDELKAFSRKPITLIKIKQDYCSNTFGELPCNALGVKCFNTFPTCKDTNSFDRTIKEYKFCSNTSFKIPAGYRPYLANVTYTSTELSESKTIPQRNTYEFLDERDFDVDIDPYLSERGFTSIEECKGTFWKKWLARNSNYKKRIIEEYQGFEGLDEAEFVKTYVGKIESIEDRNGRVIIKTVDLLKGLDELKYPFNTNSYLQEALQRFYKVDNDTDMLNFNAVQNDYCLRTDFLWGDTVSSQHEATGGSLGSGEYYYSIYGYDNYDRCIVKYPIVHHSILYGTQNKITLTWSALISPDIPKYRIFFGRDSFNQLSSIEVLGTSYEHIELNAFVIGPAHPQEAQRYYKLTGTDPVLPQNWTYYFNKFPLTLNDISEFPDSGMIKIGNEFLSYSGKTGNQLLIISRGLFESEPNGHIVSSSVYRLLTYSTGNPFTYLMDMLNMVGITSEHRSTNWTALEAAWNSVSVSLKPILKDTTMAKIIYDLVNVIDVMLWENETGLIDIKENMNQSIQFSITEAQSIVFKSQTADISQKERISRIDLYWSRVDEKEDLAEKTNYLRVNGNWNLEVESENDLGESIRKEFFTSWLNLDCGSAVLLDEYVNNLLSNKLKRLKDSHPRLSLIVELKDSDIQVGMVGRVSTTALLNIDGSPYSNVLFQVIKKDKIADNKFMLLLQHKEYPAIVNIHTIHKLTPKYSSRPALDNMKTNQPAIIFFKSFDIEPADIASIEKNLGSITCNFVLKNIYCRVSEAFPVNNRISIKDDIGTIVPSNIIDLTLEDQPQIIPIYKIYTRLNTLIAECDGTPDSGSAKLILEIESISK